MLVSPLYKNSCKRNDPSNYRPISVIPVVAKVFERIIYDQLYVHLTRYNLLSKHQFGFRSSHSTVTALLEATDSWALNIDRGLINAVVFLDLKKAFDTVGHEILLSKLRSYGIGGLALRLLRSYLVDRTQICQIDCSKSTPKFLNCGVPQGRFWARFYSYSMLTIYLSALILLILECMLTILALLTLAKI